MMEVAQFVSTEETRSECRKILDAVLGSEYMMYFSNHDRQDAIGDPDDS